MATTPNSIITPQTLITGTAVATTANSNYTAPTNTVLLLAEQPDGARITKITALARGSHGAIELQLYLSDDGGTTKNLVKSALMSVHTVVPTNGQPATDMGYSDSNPLILSPSQSLYVAIGVTNTGIVFRAEGGLRGPIIPRQSQTGMISVSPGMKAQNMSGNKRGQAEGECLLVGGGGGGAFSVGGAGGGGGVIRGPLVLKPGRYRVLIGAGGVKGTASVNAGNGGNTSVECIGVAYGGGAGRQISDTTPGVGNGGSGGSGAASPQTPGRGIDPQGRSGAAHGGGGGFGGEGQQSTNNGGTGAGGAGLDSSITGSTVNYAAGGGGAGDDSTPYAAGPAGGSSATAGGPASPAAAPANRGGGAGAGGIDFLGTPFDGGVGGSGVAILQVRRGSVQWTGGTLTTTGDFEVRRFTADGWLEVYP